MRRLSKILVRLLLLLTAIYAIVVAGFYIAMCQPPGVFSSVMAKTPGVVFAIVPFRQMWLRARAGILKVGDQAPDLSLETRDRKSKVQLSSFRGASPVVLIFGSYT